MKLLSTVRLTDNQKRVIAKIASAPTPTVAAEKISADANLIGARNELMRLGLITYTDQEATLTDKGTHIGTQENVIDDSGQLTDLGNKLAFTDSKNQPDEGEGGGSGEPPIGGDMGMGGLGGMSAGALPPGDDLGGEMGGEMGDMGGDIDLDGEQPEDPNAPPSDEAPEGQENQQPPKQMKAEGFSLLKQLLR